ncbi:TPA: 2-isopropylmalate synthase, partial [Pseudomonas aeruginosa]|nr:2-isopropylmalate synthase [Pseudomonas aeruginosa]
MIRVIDCTLREGCQARQCSFDSAQSVQLAREIAALGVDMIECGHPRISADERERVRAVVAAVSTPVLAHARARREDIDAVLETGAQWVGLFASINAISLETKFKGMNREEVLELFHDAIRYARERGLRVRATVEDAARTSVSDLVSMIATARDAGADRICFADSVGILLPDETFDVLSLLRHEFPDVVFEYHVHNDRGLALGNTLAAIQAGVQWHSASCNGIGERAGITDTFQLLTLLHTKFAADRFNLKNVLAVSELVEAHSRIKRSPMHPVVGENAFVHVARLHQLAMQENQDAYSAFDPELINGRVSLQRYTPMHRQSLFLTPFEKSASELKYHRHGPGKRFVMLDRRLLDGSPFYFIARQFHDVGDGGPGHV